MRYLLALLLLLVCAVGHAQSGRASLTGWVNFEDVAYNDGQPRATVRLFRDGEHAESHDTNTDERGRYAFEIHALGRCRLEISAEGYETYATELYLPSDFVAHWAVSLRKKANPTK